MEEQIKKHALLSPSAAHRWLRCTPSAVAEAECPDETSVYALEGSLAHALCAAKVLGKLGRASQIEALDEVAELTAEFGEIPEEMDGYAEDYATMVMGVYREEADKGNAEIHIETPLDISDWAPGAFGTGDAVIIGPQTLHVIDFKYGRGVEVSARENAQMRMYALGALDEFGVERDIREVDMRIWQPRLSNFSAETLTRDELLDWGRDYLSPLAGVAARGLGVRAPGKWCKFCKAADTCQALDSLAIGATRTDPLRTDAKSLGEICLPMTGPLEQWIESVRRQALKALTDGEAVPGYKLVRKRTLRKIEDAAKVIEILRGEGFEDERILKEPTLKPLTELERTVGKKRFAELAGSYIVKPVGEPAIAEDADRREAFDSADAFKYIEIN